MNVFEIVKFQLCQIVYKHINNELPDIFTNYFKDINFVHNYNTRAKTNRNMFLPRKNNNYGKFGVKYSAVLNWNEIPLDIKNCKTITVFNKNLKKYLINK